MTATYEGMTAVAYARVSTDDKTADGVRRQNYKIQLKDITAWAESNGVTIIEEFHDDGLTGSNMNRPGISALLGYISLNNVNLILATDCTRISRDNSDMERFLKLIKRDGVVLRYTMTDVHPEDGMGKVMNYFATNEGEQWRATHIVKVKKGLRYAQEHGTKSGKAIGRPEVEIDLVAVMECADMGFSLNKTASTLDYNRTTIRKRLNEVGRLEEYYSRCHKTLLSSNTDCINTKPEKTDKTDVVINEIVDDSEVVLDDNKDVET